MLAVVESQRTMIESTLSVVASQLAIVESMLAIAESPRSVAVMATRHHAPVLRTAYQAAAGSAT